MKTTSHLGGRKAHTARERRVRYETSTRMISWRAGLIRMIQTIVARPAGGDKHAMVGAVAAGLRAR